MVKSFFKPRFTIFFPPTTVVVFSFSIFFAMGVTNKLWSVIVIAFIAKRFMFLLVILIEFRNIGLVILFVLFCACSYLYHHLGL